MARLSVRLALSLKVDGVFGWANSQIKSSRNINPGNGRPGNDFSSLGSDFNVTMIALELAPRWTSPFLNHL